MFNMQISLECAFIINFSVAFWLQRKVIVVVTVFKQITSPFTIVKKNNDKYIFKIVHAYKL